MQRAAHAARRALAVAFTGDGERIVGHGEDRPQAQLAAAVRSTASIRESRAAVTSALVRAPIVHAQPPTCPARSRRCRAVPASGSFAVMVPALS